MSVKDKPMLVPVTLGLALIVLGAVVLASEDRPRAREFGLVVGVLPPGPLNAITDVAGVKVGHVTLIEGKGVRRDHRGPPPRRQRLPR
jgi:D-aminopeptidase